SMVCNLTVGKKKYADVEGEIKGLLARSEALRKELTELLEEDTQVYTKVSKAYKMPRETEEEKRARAEAIQDALKGATDVPMRVAEACVEILNLCTPVAEKGNVRIVSDVGVAALLAEASLRSAALNVLINLGAIKDRKFVEREGARLDALLEGKSELKEEIYDLVVEKL
ncbi:MAG: cyclodeaminase/cyclohydrolase family protein, partial [candidate division WOR-3 bacterium]|nr:cyclodeaminase/cyclohydrolase family protein [candidate division WOR-3 bacterium]